MSEPPPREGKQNVLLRQVREDHNLSQSQVAQEVGVDERTYRRWENEGTLPQPYAQGKLLRLFGKANPEELGFAERTRRTSSLAKEPDRVPVQETDDTGTAQTRSSADREEPSAAGSGNRARLLQQLHKNYVDVLEASLQGMTPLPLRLHEDSRLVHEQRLRPWLPQYPDRPLAEGTSILDAFDQAGHSLLILGAPGSGKTTLLYELALALVERARQDSTEPLPIILSLSSWTSASRSFTSWLTEEIKLHYLLPHHLVADWIQTNQILPLLDGLDELAVSAQTTCIAELNASYARQGAPLVVSSRQEDYLRQTDRLALQNAILVQPLDEHQTMAYLEQAASSLAAVREVVSGNRVLQDLLTTPLFLSIVALAYRDRSIQDIPLLGTPEEQQRAIFESYITRMLEQKGGARSYPSDRVLHWLVWLARQLRQRHQSEFYLERLQVDWLPASRWYPFLLCASIGALYSVLLGLCAALWNSIKPAAGSIDFSQMVQSFLLLGPVIGCLYIGHSPKMLSPLEGEESQGQTRFRVVVRLRTNRIFFGFSLGLLYGLWDFVYNMLLPGMALVGALLSVFIWTPLAIMIAIIVGPFDVKIQPMEVITWSWANIKRRIGLVLIACIVSGLLDGLLIAVFLPFSPSQQVTESSVVTLASFFGIMIFASLNMSIGGSITYSAIEEQQRITPNEGIKRTRRRSLQFGLIGGGMFGLIAILLLELTKLLLFQKHIVFLGGVRNGVVFTLIAGIVLWTYNGGLTWYKHIVLRFLLWHRGAIPWHYERMLDEAVQRILLYRVGGGYHFIHDLFRDYLISRDASASWPK